MSISGNWTLVGGGDGTLDGVDGAQRGRLDAAGEAGAMVRPFVNRTVHSKQWDTALQAWRHAAHGVFRCQVLCLGTQQAHPDAAEAAGLQPGVLRSGWRRMMLGELQCLLLAPHETLQLELPCALLCSTCELQCALLAHRNTVLQCTRA
eukprot:1160317-Pelagomonas_calceolata.AAC.14